MTGWGPTATWRHARRTCSPTCFGYHASWPIVRRLGLKASPAWHTDFYRAALAALTPTDQRLMILVAGAADPTAAAILAELAGDEPSIVVIDQCPTPLATIAAWARHRHPDVEVHHAQVEDLDPDDIGTFDLVVCDGLLSLLADADARHQALAQLANVTSPTGRFVYTTRLTVDGRPLEYDLCGRVLQAAVALTWPRRPPSRARLAADRWRRPARMAPYTTAAQLRDDLQGHFVDVDIDVDPNPPTRALRLHPNTLRGVASAVVRVTATHPIGAP